MYKKLVKMSRNNDYTTKNLLLDYLYHQNYYNWIGLNLPGQTKTNITQRN